MGSLNYKRRLSVVDVELRVLRAGVDLTRRVQRRDSIFKEEVYNLVLSSINGSLEGYFKWIDLQLDMRFRQRVSWLDLGTFVKFNFVLS